MAIPDDAHAVQLLMTGYPPVLLAGDGTLSLQLDSEPAALKILADLQDTLEERFAAHPLGASHGYTVKLRRTGIERGSIRIKFDLTIERVAKPRSKRIDWGKLGFYAGAAQLVVAAAALLYQATNDAEKTIKARHPGSEPEIKIRAEPPPRLFEGSPIQLKKRVYGAKKSEKSGAANKQPSDPDAPVKPNS